MRRAKFQNSWAALQKAHEHCESDVRSLLPSVDVDLSQPCLVVGGRNGAGKSRLLRSFKALHELDSVLIDVNQLVEHALSALRSRQDIEGMMEEYGSLPLAEHISSAVRSTVGRSYEFIEWYAFELELSDPAVAQRFRWVDDAPLVPYFRVAHAGQIYSALEMGLGEFSVHFLFWILEQYRDRKPLLLLLDEPDAYLPPVGVTTLLQRLLRICLQRGWKLAMTTHSEEMIRLAREHDSFLYIRPEAGHLLAMHSRDDPSAGDTLLTTPGIQLMAFCEDESAAALADALLNLADHQLARRTDIVWGGGQGYLQAMRKAIPRPPDPKLEFAFVFDGDQRDSVEPSNQSQWPAIFLPTSSDPDTLFRTLAADPAKLADELHVPANQLAQLLDYIEGEDAHDWVNALGDNYGRAVVLRGLAALWCRQNVSDAETFAQAIAKRLKPSAIEIAQAACNEATEVLGSEHATTFRLRFLLAQAFLDAGDLAKAVSNLGSVVDNCSPALGGDHPVVIAASELLEEARKKLQASSGGVEG